jgi:hypothetical protein
MKFQLSSGHAAASLSSAGGLPSREPSSPFPSRVR